MNALFCRTTQLNFASRLHQKEGPLLIEGATGTGKSQAASLIANTLKKDLIEINLAALSNELIESRIRGYKKGAFTGAEKDTPGFFEEADGKVLFLDELQSTALTSQTQLLDLLSAVSNRVRVGRIGGDSTRREYTVKVILATNRPAKDLLSEGVLREDLFHRIRDVVSFKNLNQLLKQDDYQELIKKLLTLYRWKSLAPLDADIPEVRTELIFPSIDPGIFSQIRQANWPGNFRQFERFSYDLYWALETQSSPEISRDLVRELIKREAERFFLPDEAPEKKPTTGPARKASVVEDVLTRNGMVISKSLPELADEKLKSRNTLKTFILRNKEYFSEHFLEDSKIHDFINSKNSRQNKNSHSRSLDQDEIKKNNT
ncbi:hypothetical protein GCM10007421_16840 [Halopseudomonas oceani]|nr:hypothetical protein GCM10007421_16840 [Halopseudomonas oceani]